MDAIHALTRCDAAIWDSAMSATPGLPPGSRPFMFTADLTRLRKAVFPHDATAAVEDVLLGHMASDEAGSRELLRSYAALTRVEVGIGNRAVASSPDVIVWVHPPVHVLPLEADAADARSAFRIVASGSGLAGAALVCGGPM